MCHVFGDWMMNAKGGSSIYFFVSQALGITIEDVVVDVAKKLNPKIGEGRWTRVVGYLWTIAWFTWSTVLYADWMARSGVGRSQGTPFSIVAPAMKLFGMDVYNVQHLYPPVVIDA